MVESSPNITRIERSGSLQYSSLRDLSERRTSLPCNDGEGNLLYPTQLLLKEGLEKLQHSAKNVHSAKRNVEEIIENRRESSTSLKSLSQSSPTLKHDGEVIGVPTESTLTKIGKWFRQRFDRGRNERSARAAAEDVKRAVRAVSDCGMVLNKMEDTLNREEDILNQRAAALRRQSADTFKLMNTGIKQIRAAAKKEGKGGGGGGEEGFLEDDDEEENVDEIVKDVVSRKSSDNKDQL